MLVATLMAPVVVELGAQAGLVIPLIAVHLFVFYYGIMGDITPPVGLATFAAAAISGEDAIETGIQGAVYALRTVILPFIWIFNPQLLLIDIDSIAELVLVVARVDARDAHLRCADDELVPREEPRWWENAAARARVSRCCSGRTSSWTSSRPSTRTLPAKQVYDVARDLPDGGRLVVVIKGTTIEGEDVRKTVAVRLGPKGDDGRKRLADAGLTLSPLGDEPCRSPASSSARARARPGFEQGFDIDARRGSVRPARRRTGSTCRRWR